jgi:hypothetical protein
MMLVKDLEDLDPDSCQALQDALAESGFIFEILGIDSIEEEFELRVWKAQTRQGKRQFQTLLEDWPRKLPGGSLLLKDIAGDLFCIRSVQSLNERSRKILWPYLE